MGSYKDVRSIDIVITIDYFQTNITTHHKNSYKLNGKQDH